MIFTTVQSLVFFGIISITTIFIRVLPFILFPENKKVPEYINFLGDVLPYTIIGMLVIYCLKDISFLIMPFGMPELISLAIVTILHLWKQNTLFSIGVGTAIYMFLVQCVV
jgi:branched-subunit amino acid transport protein AzlD